MHPESPLIRTTRSLTLLSLAALLALAIVLPFRPTTHAGDGEAQADMPRTTAVATDARASYGNRLGLAGWHAAGYRGRGIKVAILDSGFRGYRTHLGKSLPEKVTVRSFRQDGNLEARDSQHGILCGEVIHTLAPQAELLFANWEPDTPEAFLSAVRWAREEGARIISCSVIMPNYSDGEGGGRVHEALARILGTGGSPGDLLCFASAGNIAQRHWTGTFQADRAGFHEWQPGVADNVLRPYERERVSVELYAQPGARYDVFIHDQDTDAEVGHSLAAERKESDGVAVRFVPAAYHTYRVRVRLAGGKPGPFHLVALGGSLGCATRQGSVAFPADGPEVIAVGAVNSSGERMSYSSCGPNSRQPKPDLVAPVPFPSAWRTQPFGGTSAAAPQAAAVAAVWWSRHPEWSANLIRSGLCTAARDLGPRGHDWETGYGLVNLPAVAEEAARR
jgi:subtilisin family serine protease